MSDSPEQPWSNNPNAPEIPYWLYLAEKEHFAGYFVGATSYGIVIALFLQCMSVLLSPSAPIKKAYINDREYFGNDQYPGPIGYNIFLSAGALGTVYGAMFPSNQWLADGLLLRRCYVIYSMNHWVMAFPYLIYLAAVAMGITQLYERSGTKWETAAATNFATSYYTISLGLNVLLTLMIVTRLIRHRRNLRVVLGAPDGSSGLYTAIATMIIESYALYAVTLLAYTAPWVISSWIADIFTELAGTMQVIAPYLIILRGVKRRAVTSELISGSFESMRFRSQVSTNVDEPLPDGDPTTAMEVNGAGPRELFATEENPIEEVEL